MAENKLVNKISEDDQKLVDSSKIEDIVNKSIEEGKKIEEVVHKKIEEGRKLMNEAFSKTDNNLSLKLPSTTDMQNTVDNMNSNALTIHRDTLEDMMQKAADEVSTVVSWEGAKNLEINKNPYMSVTDSDHHYEVKADFPGLNKDNVNVNVNNGMLSISAEKQHKDKKEKEVEGEHVVKAEKICCSSCKAFSIPKNVKENEIEANFNNGILSVILPKIKTQ